MPPVETLCRGAHGELKLPRPSPPSPSPENRFVGHDVRIAGKLTSGGGADMVAVPVVLYNTDDPKKKVRTATTSTDASGYYQFTLTESVATTHAYTVCAEGRSTYSRAQSAEVLVTYATRATLAQAARARIVFNWLGMSSSPYSLSSLARACSSLGTASLGSACKR